MALYKALLEYIKIIIYFKRELNLTRATYDWNI